MDEETKPGPDNDTLPQFASLFGRYLDGHMQAAEVEQFLALLENHPEHRRLLVDVALQRVLLPNILSRQSQQADAGSLSLADLSLQRRQHEGSGRTQKPVLQRNSSQQGGMSFRQRVSEISAWRIAALFFFIASAVMTITSPTWLPWWRSTPVATLADAVDAQWDAPTERLDVGDHLPYGPLFLKSGYASIQLDNGVKLIVQGPAHFSVDSLMLAHLDDGKLTADVPHTARGYAVKIPSGMVTDIGTIFGVTAFANTESTVQVLKGSVQAQLFSADGKQKEKVVLTEDHAVALSPFAGTLASVPVDQDAYATDIRHLPVPPETPYARWQKYSDQLRKDSSLLAYYAFNNKDEAPDKLLNRAAATSGQYDGQIENATWDDGRFPGKQALRFNGQDSFVKINIPQQSNQLTLAAWVRIDSLAHDITGFLISDDWNRPGEVAWQIAYERHAVTVGGGFVLDTPSPADTIGQWVLLAATLDAQSSKITLYRNGVVQVSQKVNNAVPMKIGSAQIGSWNALTSTDSARNRTLNGRIDELAIFSRIMTDAEIQAMYREGHANEK